MHRKVDRKQLTPTIYSPALYLNWIAVLDTTGDFRGMINGFVNSAEYRARFGP